MATLYSRNWITNLVSRWQRLNPSHFLRWADSFFLLTLATASPSKKSLLAGASFLGAGCFLLAWTQGFDLAETKGKAKGAIVGPFRFVRSPERLASFLLAFGLSISARSFPSLLLSLVLLPLLDWFDRKNKNGSLWSSDLAGLRYRQHVPVLVPTVFPYSRRLPSSEKGAPRFSWRRAFFRVETPRVRLLLLVGGSWSLCLLLSTDWIPRWGALLLGLGAIVWDLSLYYRKLPTHNHEFSATKT